MPSLKDVVSDLTPFLIDVRRHFHAYPELSGKECESAKTIRHHLTEAGIHWARCGMETATVAVIEGKGPGKTVLLRADMDALPVTETSGLPYASCRQGIMHACGHDCHMAMLLTCAKVLEATKDQWSGTVKLAFQPAEESGEGALAMIEAGVLDDVDACFALHVWSDVPSGKVALRSGPVMAGTDRFEIHVKGVGGHGAQPHHCVDAVVAGSAIVQQLQTLVSREVAPTETAVVTVGTFEAGTRWNVIAGEAKLTGTVRSFNPALAQQLPDSFIRVVQMTAQAHRATAEVTYVQMALPTVNDPAVTELAKASATKVFGQDGVYDLSPSMGGEDFCHFLAKKPGCFGFLGVRNEACGAIYGQHHSAYVVDENALPLGVMLYAQFAIDFLNKNHS